MARDQDAVIEAPREQRSRAKRGAILQGAKRVFMARGYGASSMDAVAEAAGVSKMTLYRHFDGKEALFAGLIEELCENMLAGELEAVMADLLPAEALRRFARRFIDTIFAPETIELHRVVLAEVTRFPELGRLFYESGPARNIAALAGYFVERADDPDAIAAAETFLEMLRGYTHLRVLLGVEPIPDAAAREALIERAVKRFLGDD